MIKPYTAAFSLPRSSTVSSRSRASSTFSSGWRTNPGTHSGYAASDTEVGYSDTAATPSSSAGSVVPFDVTAHDLEPPPTYASFQDSELQNGTTYSFGAFQSRASTSRVEQSCATGMLDPPSGDSRFGDLVKSTSANGRKSVGRWTRGVSRIEQGGRSFMSKNRDSACSVDSVELIATDETAIDR